MLQDIYDKSMTVDASLSLLADAFVINKVSIARRLQGIESDRQEILDKSDTNTLELAQATLNTLVDTRSKLMDILTDGFMQYVRNGTFYAFAYASQQRIEHITQYDWAFLKMDFQKDCATGNGKQFAQIRVIQASQVSSEERERFTQFDSGLNINSINPIPNASDEDIQAWAKEDWWHKDVAISHVTSSRCVGANLLSAKGREKWTKVQSEAKNLLARTIGMDWLSQVPTEKKENGIYVSPYEWLIWCESQGVKASQALWGAVNVHWRRKKAAGYCDQYPGVEPDDIARILDIDDQLCPNPNLADLDSCAILFDKYDQQIGQLLQDGWDEDKARLIAAKIIESGGKEVELKEANDYMDTLTSNDSDYIRKKKEAKEEIETLQGEIKEINKAFDGEANTQSKEGLSVFKTMSFLTADEVSISFTANTWLEIKARGKKVPVHCDKLELMKKTKPSGGEPGLNQQGRILFDMTQKKYPEGTAAGKAVSRLKTLLVKHVNIKGDIFKPKKERWEPLLHALNDETKRSDDRAKYRAIIRSHDDLTDKNHYDNLNYEESPENRMIDAELTAEYGDIHSWTGDKQNKN